MLGWDKHLERWQVGHRAGFLDPIFKGLTYAGTDGALWLAIALVAALVWWRPRLFAFTLAADAVALLLAEGLKAAIPRARPQLHPLVARPHSHSFPSGHAATSFACATVLAAALPRYRVAFVLLAAAIAWSRVYVGVHYPLDVVAGAALGLGVGYAVIRGLPRLGAVRRRSRRTRPAG